MNELTREVYHRTLRADRGDAGQRLDRVLQRHLAGTAEVVTRARIQAWISQGFVQVNGSAARRAATRAAWRDVLTIELPPGEIAPRRSVPEAERGAIDVLYEDEHLLAVNKPAGVVVHPSYKHARGTLMNVLLWRARNWPAPCRPSLVGRLDRLTSGVLIVAKTSAVHAALQRELASGRADKSYLALVHGRMRAARGRIDLRLGRDPHDRRRVVASPSAGAPSLTHFERLARTPAGAEALSLVCCRLATGRMHQIRVHLAARGWPIVGDPVYGRATRRQDSHPALVDALSRQALHAWRTSFRHPATGTRLQIEAPIPSDMFELMCRAGLRWRP